MWKYVDWNGYLGQYLCLQVVRADVKDLNNEELDGAPYGFVPFCESRKEIEGFR